MNGKETIQCIDTDPLTSLGFVSGDVVYIILEPSLENVSHSCTPSSAASNTNQAESSTNISSLDLHTSMANDHIHYFLKIYVNPSKNCQD